MAAGKRRKRIVIEQSTLVADAAGQLVPTWSTYCERWGEALAVTGGETFRARQLEADVTWLIRLRSDSETRGITPQMRLRFDGNTVNIGRVYDAEGRRREIEIQGKEPDP